MGGDDPHAMQHGMGVIPPCFYAGFFSQGGPPHPMARCKNHTPNAFFKTGAPGPGRAPSFSTGYFLETRTRILTTPTFKKKLSLQASKPFPEGAPRKVSMFKIYLAGRSSDMSVSCPETIFFSPKWRDSGCGFFKILTFQEHKVLACQEQLLACQDTSFLGSNMPWWLWKVASGGLIF